MADKRVLIVEDDAIVANFIQIKLEDMGYAVPAKARTGQEAIDMAKKHQPDLILMDVMLEGDIDGIEAVEQITKIIDIPVIYLTASSDEQTVNRLMKTEPHGFLIKPFDDRILSSAIHIAVFRHKTKKELFDTKEMLRTTMQSIDDMVFGLDTSGAFTHKHSQNKYRHEIFREENIVGKTIRDVFPADVAKRLYESVQWVIDYQKPHSVEFTLQENGIDYWFNCKLTLRNDPRGNTPGITMVVSDITASKNMYQELLLSQEKLSEAQDIAMLGSYDVFFQEKKFVFNDMFFKILDIEDPQKIMNFSDDTLMEIMHPDDRSRYSLIKQKLLRDKRTDFSVDYRITDRQGNIRYIHAVGQMKYNKDGEPVRMITTIQDITGQKNNEKLRHEVEMTKKTAEMKQKFFARLSHEIRNPLSGITGLLGLLERTNVDERQREYIEALKISSDNLLQLLNDVLDYTKIEAGMMKVSPVEFDIRTTFKNLQTFFMPQALEKGLTFNISLPDNLPCCLLGDEGKIIQVISNFISNALKFTDTGLIELRASYANNIENDESIILRVEVEDSGSGISPNDLNSLFIDFSQLGNARSGDQRGSGLGLSICRELIELMGGKIGVHSEGIGSGSLFWFTLPVIATAAHQTEAPKNEVVPVNQREKLTCSVLLVEDMLVNQKVIKHILEDMGCTVSIASNGLKAIEMFHESQVNAFDIFGKIHYDIILMDHIMPVMDGLSALQKLKADFKEIPPVIVLTADESFALDQFYLKSGFDDCIIKPVIPSELYDKIQRHVKVSAKQTGSQPVEAFSIEDVELKPVINPSTIDLILKQARSNNFDIEVLFTSFIDDMERIYGQSLAAVEMNDFNTLRLIIMTVKGLSGNIGASQVHAIAKHMDRYMRNERYEDAKALLPLLIEKYGIFKNMIENKYLKEFVSRQ